MKFLVVIAALALSACAARSTKSSPEVFVIRTATIKPIAKLVKIEPVPLKEAFLQVLSFEDARAQKDYVGEARTGMSNRVQPIAFDISIPEYFKQRFTQGFSARGVNVVDNATYGLRGKVTKFWVKETADGLHAENSTCELEVQLEVVRLKTQQPVYRGMASSEVTGTNSIVDTTDSNGPVLETCMEHVLNKILKDQNLEALMVAPPSKK